MVRRLLQWSLGGAFAVALIVAGAVLWASTLYRDPGPSAAETVVVLPAGSGVGRIATLLDDAGVIDQPWLFAAAVKLRDKTARLQAGEYAFPAGVSIAGVIDMLVRGQAVVHRLTVPEGLTVAQVLALVAGAGALDGEVGPPPPEGSLLPDTYHFSRGDSRAGLVQRMRQAMDQALATLWPARDLALPLASPAEAVILASIVEKETAVAAERALIAGVFYNRLRRGMRLQSDPTVVFALSQGSGELNRPLTRADLKVADPYNTYTSDGLPPGPIANPGRAALEAVLHPQASKNLYFVADGTGGHAFAATLSEHNRNVAKWRKINRR
ncbi:MAG: endolytic transglycosylase MltG [Alphaproteobacteria bacterium]